MAAITALAITITPPGLAPVTVNCTSAEAAAGGATTAVEQVTVAWGQPTPIDSQEPGRLDFQLVSADPLPAPWESEVTIDASIDGRPSVRIGRGWVSSAKYRPYGDLWLSKITLTDVIGRASATKAPAAATWPSEETGDRIARIVLAAGWDVDGDEVLDFSATVAPAKVTTSDTIYDLLDRALRAWPAAAVEGATGITAAYLNADVITWQGHFISDGVPFDTTINPAATTPVDLDAAVIGSIWRGPDRASALTQIRYTTRDAAGEAVEHVLTTSGVAGSTAELAIAADVTYDSNHAANYRELLADIDGRALVVLDPGPIRLQDLDAATVEALIAVPGRAARPIHIANCPDDVDPFQTLTAATLTIDPKLKSTLDATLKPTRLRGVRPLRFSDWPTTGDLPPTDVADDRTYEPATFNRCGTITAAQTQTVSHPRRDRYTA